MISDISWGGVDTASGESILSARAVLSTTLDQVGMNKQTVLYFLPTWRCNFLTMFLSDQ